MSLCILTGGATLALATGAFTLSWTHSVERTRWEEDWRVTAAGLELVEARVAGSGAGMEPPEGAVLRDGFWTFAPDLPPMPEVLLAASGATGGGWRLCAAAACLDLGAHAGAPVRLAPCPGRRRVGTASGGARRGRGVGTVMKQATRGPE
jgi:hypothetical protein